MTLRNQTFRKKDKNTIVLHIHGAPQQVMQIPSTHQAKVQVVSSGWSLIRRSLIGAVFHHEGLSSGQSFIWKVFHYGSLSSGQSFIVKVSHQGSLSSGWSFISGSCFLFCFLSGWSFNWAVFHQGGLSSGQSIIIIRVVF